MRQPQEEISIRFQAMCGEGDKCFQIPDSSHSGKVERWRRRRASQIFQALAPHCDLVKSTDPGGFLKKSSLLGHRIEEGEGNPGEYNFKGQSGESGATADVEQFPMQLYVPGKKKAFSKVARHTLFRVADGREVDFLIPAKKQLKIGEDLAVLGG